jgi:flagellar biosynthesis protein FlhA
MLEDSKFEYLVRTCPIENTDELQELLNEMSADGWELYSLHEAEGEEGFQYNCIFTRAAEGFHSEHSEVGNVGIKSRMEKLFSYKNDPYEQAKSLQKQIKDKNQRISEIKEHLDSNSIDIDRESLNQEISKKLSELQAIKAKFVEVLSPAHMYERVNQDILTVVLSEELADLIDNEKNGELILETVRIRQNLVDKLGYIMPAINFVVSDEMSESQYSINIRKFKAISGLAYPEFKLFYQGQANIERKPRGAIDDIDPVTGQKAFWIAETKTKNFWDKGLSASQVIASHLEFVVCKYIEEVMSYSDVLNYISLLGEENLFLAEELLHGAYSLADMRCIFAKLIREKISVRDIVFVFEKLNDLTKFEYTVEQTVDNLRILLSRQICGDIADANNLIYGIIPTAEQNTKLKKALNKLTKGKYFVQNNDVKEFTKYVLEKINLSEASVENTAIIVKPELRQPVFYLFEQLLPQLVVISEDEIAEEFTVEEL